MRVLIIGSGAVGLGLGSCLIKTGMDTTFIAGKKTVDALKADGLCRSGIFGEFNAAPETFSTGSDLRQISVSPYDFILICTKSNHVETAVKTLYDNQELVKNKTKIVHFQNGWGNAEKLLTCFPKEIIYTGRVITGFTRPRPNHVCVTVHADAVHVGSLFGKSLEPVRPLCRAINDGGIPCMVWKDIEKDLWAKMLYNCALNPLGAILKVSYGKLAGHSHTCQVMDRIIEEVFAVMKAADYKTYWASAAEYKETFYHQLIPPTADHKSSTLQDIVSGKKTEIEALTGEIIHLAKKKGIDVPCNQMLFNLIRFIEEN